MFHKVQLIFLSLIVEADNLGLIWCLQGINSGSGSFHLSAVLSVCFLGLDFMV